MQHPIRRGRAWQWLVPVVALLSLGLILLYSVPRSHAIAPASLPTAPCSVLAAAPQLAETLAIAGITGQQPVQQALAALSESVAEQVIAFEQAANQHAAAKRALASAISAARDGRMSPQELASQRAATESTAVAHSTAQASMLDTMAATLDSLSESSAVQIRAVLEAQRTGVPGESGLVGMSLGQAAAYAAAVAKDTQGDALEFEEQLALDLVNSHPAVITYRTMRASSVPVVQQAVGLWVALSLQGGE
ncbi:MAG: hypothetical protein ACTS3F_02450 [Phycisphaerales bacterium]